jgi:hypothetical protein
MRGGPGTGSRSWRARANIGLLKTHYLEEHIVREYADRLAIQRHDGERLTWGELQAIKCSIWGDRVAIEVYPAASVAVGLRHTRHLWWSPGIELAAVSGCRHWDMNTDELLARYAAGERDFRYARLRGAQLDGADLSGADLSGADLSDANLHWACLAGANLNCTVLFRACLTRASLVGANLSGAQFDSARLDLATLEGANLTDADLSHSNLRAADLSDATLTGIRLSSAHMESVIGVQWAACGWSEHGVCGRMLLGVMIDGAPRLFCGCFEGSAEELMGYIANSDADLEASRTRAATFVLESLRGTQ